MEHEELELPEGDYNMQVHLLELKDVPVRENEAMMNPMAIIEILGQRQYSSSKKSSTGDFYDETFYFYFKDLKKEQIAEASLKITIMDKAYMLGVALPKKLGYFDGRVGTYQVDMIQIYSSRDHEMYRRWGTLRDPYNEDDPGPRGLLKFSVACLGPGDKQRPHDPSREPNDDEDEADIEQTEGAAVIDGGSGVGGGSGATLQFLVIGIVRADGLPGFDRFISTINTGLYAYVQCEFAGCKPVKTTRVAVVGRKNLTVNFDEEIWIPVWVPTLSKRAAVTVMNSELGRGDQVVATAYFDFGDVKKYETDPVSSGGNPFAVLGMMKKSYSGQPLKYLHFYGANPLVRGGPKAAKFMNRFPNYGSAYRGSLLCSLRVVKKHTGIETPHKKSMSYEIPSSLLPQNAKYVIKLMVYQGTDFGNKGFGSSGKSGKYALGLNIGQYELKCSFKSYENGGVEWVELIENDTIMLPSEVRHLPDTFITLYRGSETSYQSVAFARLQTLHIVSKGTDVSAQWYELQHDQSHKSNPLIQGYPGSVLLRLAVVNLEDVGKPMEWDSERVKMNVKEPYNLRVYVFQCRNLPAINDNGLIDPYVKVRFSGSKQKTTSKKMTQSPCFFEVLEFVNMLVVDKKLAPNIVLQVWDSKFGGKMPVGVVRAPLDGVNITNAANAANAGIPTPKWMQLKGIDGKGNMGEILASFQLFRKETLDKRLTVSREIIPSLRKCYLDLHIVGLRNLTKMGYSNLRYPFLELDLVSHAYGDKVQSSTCRVPSPNNPNFLDRFVMLTNIPDDPLYCPMLEVRVYDQRRTGKQLIAVTHIDLITKLPWNGSEYIPPRQHSLMSDTIKARKEIDAALAKFAKNKRRGGAMIEEEEAQEEAPKKTVKIVDEGYGLFPPEVGASEPGAKYLELPAIIDQQEYDAQRKEILAEIAAEDAALPMETQGGINAAIRKLLKIPSAWSKTNFMEKRDWWIDSKKEGEGGALEDYLKTYAFENYPLYRGHIAFNKFGKRKDTTLECGVLKAVLRVCPKNPRNDEEYNNFNRTIRKVEKCIVRVYIIKAQNLQPLDWMGTSDPFLKVSLGSKEMKSKAIAWNLNPDFFETYQFETTLPGPSLLRVQLWDKNVISSHQLMGETIVDLEDRWYHPKWTALAPKPVEARTLLKKGTNTSQGLVYLWTDIFRVSDQGLEHNKRIDIAGPEKKMFEIRISCWRSLGVPNVDGDASDLYVRFAMAGGQPKDTDTHWRCKGGSGSWNWRIKIMMELPIKNREEARLTVKMMEKNIFTADTLIGQNTINLYDWFLLAYTTDTTIQPFKRWNEAKAAYEEGEELPDAQDEEKEEDEAAEVEAEAVAAEEGEEGSDEDEKAKLIKAPAIKATPLKGEGEDESEGKDKEKDKKKKKKEDEEEGGGNLAKIQKQIMVLLGVGKYIADDAEWVQLSIHDRENNRVKSRGEVAVSISIVPKTEYEQQPVGNGRSEPNQDPYLPPPTGRFSFSLDPMKILAELCPMWLRICLCCCCCCCCCMLFLILAMTQLSGVMSLVDLIEQYTPTPAPTYTATPDPTNKPTHR